MLGAPLLLLVLLWPLGVGEPYVLAERLWQVLQWTVLRGKAPASSFVHRAGSSGFGCEPSVALLGHPYAGELRTGCAS